MKERDKPWKQSQKHIQQVSRQSPYQHYKQVSRRNSLERQMSQRKRSEYSRDKYKINFEALQNNLRLDITKYKAKIEELQRSIEQKNRQVRSLNQELNKFKMSEYNKMFYNEQISNKSKLLETYENYLKQTRKENEQLRNKKLDLEKSIVHLQENKKYEIEKIYSEFEKTKYNYVKEIDITKQELKYLQFEIQGKNTKIQKMKLMIEQYENKMTEIEQQCKDLLKHEKSQSKKRYQILLNQFKCFQSTFQIGEITIKDLQKQNSDLKYKIKDKQTQLLLILQEIGILKSEISGKDEFKIKFAELSRIKNQIQKNNADLDQKNQKLREKNQELDILSQKLEFQTNQIRKENKLEKEKNEKLSRTVQELKDKIFKLESLSQKNSKISKTFEWEIKYIQQNEKDWREVMKAKNEKILQLTEMIEKNKKQYSIQQMRNIRQMNSKDSEIAQLNIRLFELESELLQFNSVYRPNYQRKVYKFDLQVGKSPSNPSILNFQETYPQKDWQGRLKFVEYKLGKQIQLKNEKIGQYENYINRYIDSKFDTRQMQLKYENDIKSLQNQIGKKDGIIESLNQLIYERDKEHSSLFEKSKIKIYDEDKMNQKEQVQAIDKKIIQLKELKKEIIRLQDCIRKEKQIKRKLQIEFGKIETSLREIDKNAIPKGMGFQVENCKKSLENVKYLLFTDRRQYGKKYQQKAKEDKDWEKINKLLQGGKKQIDNNKYQNIDKRNRDDNEEQNQRREERDIQMNWMEEQQRRNQEKVINENQQLEKRIVNQQRQMERVNTEKIRIDKEKGKISQQFENYKEGILNSIKNELDKKGRDLSGSGYKLDEPLSKMSQKEISQKYAQLKNPAELQEAVQELSGQQKQKSKQLKNQNGSPQKKMDNMVEKNRILNIAKEDMENRLKQLQAKQKNERQINQLAKIKAQAQLHKIKNQNKALQMNIDDKNSQISRIYTNKFGQQFTSVQKKINGFQSEISKKDKLISDAQAKYFYVQTLLEHKEEELELQKHKNNSLQKTMKEQIKQKQQLKDMCGQIVQSAQQLKKAQSPDLQKRLSDKIARQLSIIEDKIAQTQDNLVENLNNNNKYESSIVPQASNYILEISKLKQQIGDQQRQMERVNTEKIRIDKEKGKISQQFENYKEGILNSIKNELDKKGRDLSGSGYKLDEPLSKMSQKEISQKYAQLKNPAELQEAVQELSGQQKQKSKQLKNQALGKSQILSLQHSYPLGKIDLISSRVHLFQQQNKIQVDKINLVQQSIQRNQTKGQLKQSDLLLKAKSQNQSVQDKFLFKQIKRDENMIENNSQFEKGPQIIDKYENSQLKRNQNKEQLFASYDVKLFELENNMLMKDYQIQKHSIRNSILQSVLNNQIKESASVESLICQIIEITKGLEQNHDQEAKKNMIRRLQIDVRSLNIKIAANQFAQNSIEEDNKDRNQNKTNNLLQQLLKLKQILLKREDEIKYLNLKMEKTNHQKFNLNQEYDLCKQNMRNLVLQDLEKDSENSKQNSDLSEERKSRFGSGKRPPDDSNKKMIQEMIDQGESYGLNEGFKNIMNQKSEQIKKLKLQNGELKQFIKRLEKSVKKRELRAQNNQKEMKKISQFTFQMVQQKLYELEDEKDLVATSDKQIFALQNLLSSKFYELQKSKIRLRVLEAALKNQMSQKDSIRDVCDELIDILSSLDKNSLDIKNKIIEDFVKRIQQLEDKLQKGNKIIETILKDGGCQYDYNDQSIVLENIKLQKQIQESNLTIGNLQSEINKLRLRFAKRKQALYEYKSNIQEKNSIPFQNQDKQRTNLEISLYSTLNIMQGIVLPNMSQEESLQQNHRIRKVENFDNQMEKTQYQKQKQLKWVRQKNKQLNLQIQKYNYELQLQKENLQKLEEQNLEKEKLLTQYDLKLFQAEAQLKKYQTELQEAELKMQLIENNFFQKIDNSEKNQIEQNIESFQKIGEIGIKKPQYFDKTQKGQFFSILSTKSAIRKLKTAQNPHEKDYDNFEEYKNQFKDLIKEQQNRKLKNQQKYQIFMSQNEKFKKIIYQKSEQVKYYQQFVHDFLENQVYNKLKEITQCSDLSKRERYDGIEGRQFSLQSFSLKPYQVAQFQNHSHQIQVLKEKFKALVQNIWKNQQKIGLIREQNLILHSKNQKLCNKIKELASQTMHFDTDDFILKINQNYSIESSNEIVEQKSKKKPQELKKKEQYENLINLKYQRLLDQKTKQNERLIRLCQDLRKMIHQMRENQHEEQNSNEINQIQLRRAQVKQNVQKNVDTLNDEIQNEFLPMIETTNQIQRSQFKPVTSLKIKEEMKISSDSQDNKNIPGTQKNKYDVSIEVNKNLQNKLNQIYKQFEEIQNELKISRIECQEHKGTALIERKCSLKLGKMLEDQILNKEKLKEEISKIAQTILELKNYLTLQGQQKMKQLQNIVSELNFELAEEIISLQKNIQPHRGENHDFLLSPMNINLKNQDRRVLNKQKQLPNIYQSEKSRRDIEEQENKVQIGEQGINEGDEKNTVMKKQKNIQIQNNIGFLSKKSFQEIMNEQPQLAKVLQEWFQKPKKTHPLLSKLTSQNQLNMSLFLFLLGQYIRQFKIKYNHLQQECSSYFNIMQSDFIVKNELKKFNRQLIDKKSDMGKVQSENARKIFLLEGENSRLKAQLDNFMKEYQMRTKMFTSLKNNLCLLNSNIQNSQDQTAELKIKANKYHQKINAKQQQLREKQDQIVSLQARYKNILLSYISQIEKLNKQIELQRRKNIDQKSSLKQDINSLKHTFNELKFDYQKILKENEFLKLQIDFQRSNNISLRGQSSAYHKNLAQSSKIQQKLRFYQEERSRLLGQIDKRDSKAIQIEEQKGKLQIELAQLKEVYQDKFRLLERQISMKQIEFQRKKLQMENIITDIKIKSFRKTETMNIIRTKETNQVKDQGFDANVSTKQLKKEENEQSKLLKKVESESSKIVKQQSRGLKNQKQNDEKKVPSSMKDLRLHEQSYIKFTQHNTKYSQKQKPERLIIEMPPSMLNVVSPRAVKTKKNERNQIGKLKSYEKKNK